MRLVTGLFQSHRHQGIYYPVILPKTRSEAHKHVASELIIVPYHAYRK
jgi:hypothetical protein